MAIETQNINKNLNSLLEFKQKSIFKAKQIDSFFEIYRANLLKLNLSSTFAFVQFEQFIFSKYIKLINLRGKLKYRN